MTDASLIALFVRPLNQLRIPYMVTGAVASVVYGEPRLTRFNVIHHQTALRADFYLSGDDALNAWAFVHRVVRRIDDDVFLAPIEG